MCELSNQMKQIWVKIKALKKKTVFWINFLNFSNYEQFEIFVSQESPKLKVHSTDYWCMFLNCRELWESEYHFTVFGDMSIMCSTSRSI